MADITDAYAEPPLPSEKKAGNFVTLWGLARFSAYLVDHRAEKAVLLLLAIQRRMDVKHKTKVALTSDVWKDAGDPSRTARETILAHLRRMPDWSLSTRFDASRRVIASKKARCGCRSKRRVAMVWRRRKRLRTSYEQQGFHCGKIHRSATARSPMEGYRFVVMYGLHGSSGLNAYPSNAGWSRLFRS